MLVFRPVIINVQWHPNTTVHQTMAKNILGQSLYQLTVVFGILFYGDKIFDIESGRGAGKIHIIETEVDVKNSSKTHYIEHD